MSADPKTQARAALDQQEAIGKAVARGERTGYAKALGEVLARLGLEPVATGANGNQDAIERIAVFAKAPKS